jgi:hypothetical protein
MTPNEIATIIATVLQSSGLAIFLIFIFRSLKREIASLRRIIDDQTKTLDVMERRVLETEKVGTIYQHLIRELPEDLEKYKTLIANLKNEMIQELELANQRKDQELARVTQQQLNEIENQEHAVLELQDLRHELVTVVRSMEERLSGIANRPIALLNPGAEDYDDIFDRWTDYMRDRGLVIKEKEDSDSCFITSACIYARGRNADCVELTAIRWWRDSYVRRRLNGENLIKDYYRIAPAIVSAINQDSNKQQIYESLYKNLVLKTVEFIAAGKKEEAFSNYWEIVCDLKANYAELITG